MSIILVGLMGWIKRVQPFSLMGWTYSKFHQLNNERNTGSDTDESV